MNEGRLQLVLAQQRLRDLHAGRGGHRLAVGREDRHGMRAIGQVDCLDVGDLLGPETEERVVRERLEDRGGGFVVVFHGYLLGSSQREPARRAVMSIVLSASACRPESMRMVRMRGSTCGRTSSIDSRPLSSRAPVTSMPSASMKAR